MTKQCGTLAYVAPEVISGKGYKGFASDIWGSGVILYTMIYGAIPFRSSDKEKLRLKIITGDYLLPEIVSEDARDLLRRVLDINPNTRFTIPQILSHRWFNDYDDSLSLFNSKEMLYIDKEFEHSKEGTELFVESEVDVSNSKLSKSNTSKSVILAPYNSAKEKTEESIVCIMQPIKFNAKVKKIDRKYEKNNNYELDNGIYNNQSPILTATVKTKMNIKNVIKRSLVDSLIQKPLVIDEEIVEKVVKLGYPKAYIIKSLEESEHNYATTSYYLLSSL